MAKNRTEFEKYIIKFMTSLTKGGHNGTIYKNLFSRLNDKQLEEFIVSLENGKSLSIWLSNFDEEEMLDWDNLIKLADDYGYSMIQQLIVYDRDTGVRTLSPIKGIVGKAEARKQRQMLVKKIGYSKDDSMIDNTTGQVISKSRGAGLSFPELGVLLGLGLKITANEIYSVNGGDMDAFKAYKNELIETGKTTTVGALKKGSGVKSLKTVHRLMRGRMLDNNFNER